MYFVKQTTLFYLKFHKAATVIVELESTSHFEHAIRVLPTEYN